jgi:nicotinamidase-related amidase
MLVVELQNDLAAPELVNERGLAGALARAVAKREVLAKLQRVLDACRAAGVPVLYATKERHPAMPQPGTAPIYKFGPGDKLVHGTRGAAVIDEIAPKDGDILLPRFTSIDPSYGSELWPVVRRLGVSTLVVAGISTTMAVEGTVRAAANRELRVVVIEDCCASVPDEWHEFSVRNVMPLIAEVASHTDVLEALA